MRQIKGFMPFNWAECLVIVWGNVREVVSETGETKLVNAYYPFDTPIHALGTNECQQRYKYNGKEFDELHGLNTYDYGGTPIRPAAADVG